MEDWEDQFNLPVSSWWPQNSTWEEKKTFESNKRSEFNWNWDANVVTARWEGWIRRGSTYWEHDIDGYVLWKQKILLSLERPPPIMVQTSILLRLQDNTFPALDACNNANICTNVSSDCLWSAVTVQCIAERSGPLARTLKPSFRVLLSMRRAHIPTWVTQDRQTWKACLAISNCSFWKRRDWMANELIHLLWT